MHAKKNEKLQRLILIYLCKQYYNFKLRPPFAQWIHLRLPSCGPGFESQYQHIHFLQFLIFNWKLWCEKDDKTKITAFWEQLWLFNTSQLNALQQFVVPNRHPRCDCSSVTRFGEISPFWQNMRSLGQFLRVYFLLGRIFDRLCKFCLPLSKSSLM